MQWFKNLNAMPRLMISFGVLMVLILGISSLAISNLSQANDRLGALYQQDMVGSMRVNDIAVARAMNGRSIRDAMLHMNNPAVVASDEKESFADIEAIRSDIEIEKKASASQESQDALAIISRDLPAYEEGHRDAYQRIEGKDVAGAEATLAAATAAAKPLFDAVAQLREIKQRHAQEKFDKSIASYTTARGILLGAVTVSLILALLMSFGIARGFSVPLGQAVRALRCVAEGDLTATLDIETHDEVGRMGAALNDALERLRETLQQVSEGSLNTTSAAQQLAAATEAIASGAQEQAASLEETSASLEEITATVRQSADNARQASQLASGSRDAAEQGQQVVSNAVTAMGEINAASAKIAEIISTIDEIAFQTNLLAVNAAVEAARAGEEGRGFAVVAAEVRSLAQRSAQAAKEIKLLIQDSLRKVERGTELVNKSGETLQGIVNSVKRVTDIVGEIAAAAGEQSTGVEQVNTAMTQMDRVTQSNSAQTEELSSTAESLSEQAGKLLELVKTFTLSKGGKNQFRGPAPARSRAVAARPAVSSRAHAPARFVSAAKSEGRGAAVTQPAPVPAHALATVGAEGGDNDASFEEF